MRSWLVLALIGCVERFPGRLVVENLVGCFRFLCSEFSVTTSLFVSVIWLGSCRLTGALLAVFLSVV